MIDFLTLIEYELNRVETIIEPSDDIQPGEDIVGEISEELQKFYTVWKQTGKTAGALENDMRWGNVSPETMAQVQELKTKAQAIYLLFWIAVQDEMKRWDPRDHLAIRKGFKLVKCPQPEIPNIFRIWGGPA